MSGVGVGIRALSTGAGLLIVGVLAMSLLAGPSDKPTARRWQQRLARSTRWLAALLLVSGVAALGWQVTVVTGRADSAADGGAWLRLLGATHFGTVWLLARRAKAVSVFERIALPLLLLAGLLAGRNTVWLGLAVAVSGPLLLDAEWRSETLIDPRLRRVNVRLSIVAILIATVAITARLAQPEAGLLHAWPEAGASAVVAAAGPSGIVLSDDIHSDWLLWEKPVLIGRLAYDIRFELLDKAQFTKLRAIRSGAGGNRLTRQYKVLTFDPYQEAMPNLGRGRVVYRSPGFVVVREPG